jgi:hypothetical protein
MDFEETHRLGAPGYDERTETWYVQQPESSRLMLTRQSLARLVQMYNSIHKGNTLVLLEQRELRRLEESRRRHSQALRDFYVSLDSKKDHRWFQRLRRFFLSLCPGGRRS